MQKTNKQIDRILAIPALIILITAWFIGNQLAESSLTEQIESHLPAEVNVELIQDDIFLMHPDTTSYLVNGWSNGYGGKLRSSLIFSSSGKVSRVLITADKETPSFLKRLDNKKFLQKIIGLDWESLVLEENMPDVISGATFTSQAILNGATQAARLYATDVLKKTNLPEPTIQKIHWSSQHSILLVVLVLSILVTRTEFLKKIKARWILLVFNLVFLGFWTGNQLSIIQFSRITSGEFPPIGQHLFFYLLLSGSMFFILALNKNLYYDRVCPFGAAQECLGELSGTKKTLKDRRNRIRWIPRILALGLLTLGLIFRHPTSINYEVFTAFFKIVGNSLQFALLLVVLITSLFFRRPWCQLLCPVKPVLSYIHMVRNWILESLRIK